MARNLLANLSRGIGVGLAACCLNAGAFAKPVQDDAKILGIYIQVTSFDIESNHLLIVGDDAGFAGGRTIGIDDHASTSTTMSPQLLQQSSAAFIRSDESAQIGLSTEGQNVVIDIRGATEIQRLGFDMDDRHRSLRRNPAHLAPNIMIEDQIADHQHAGLWKPLNVSGKF